MKHLKILSILAVGAVAMVSLQALAAGTWTPPTEAPPGGNVDAPVNVGDTFQIKEGSLQINRSLGIVGNLIVGTSSPSVGKVLTALDNVGTVGWRSLTDAGWYGRGGAFLCGTSSPCPTDGPATLSSYDDAQCPTNMIQTGFDRDVNNKVAVQCARF